MTATKRGSIRKWNISIPIHYPVGCNEYHPEKFRTYSEKFLSKEGCPICHGDHEAKFHCFAGRAFRDGSVPGANVTTAVPRFICELNRLIRQQSGEEKQYTITILPGFLISYSTVPVDPVHNAVAGYLGASGLTQVGAALRMHCFNAISFRVFLNRVRDRIEGWITLLVEQVHDLEGQVKGVDVSRTPPNDPESPAVLWKWFAYLSAEYLRLHARIPGTEVVPKQFHHRYIHCLLSRHHMGLGP